jgi:hypothetical protein
MLYAVEDLLQLKRMDMLSYGAQLIGSTPFIIDAGRPGVLS